jgi:hypothetical protein
VQLHGCAPLSEGPCHLAQGLHPMSAVQAGA